MSQGGSGGWALRSYYRRGHVSHAGSRRLSMQPGTQALLLGFDTFRTHVTVPPLAVHVQPGGLATGPFGSVGG